MQTFGGEVEGRGGGSCGVWGADCDSDVFLFFSVLKSQFIQHHLGDIRAEIEARVSTSVAAPAREMTNCAPTAADTRREAASACGSAPTDLPGGQQVDCEL